MNSEVLQYLIEHPDEVDEIKARELEEVSSRFPFYDVPLILLSRYYYHNRDYRYTGTLEKCALRVSDRSWLKSFVESELIFRKPDTEQPHTLVENDLTLVENKTPAKETSETEENVYVQEQINRVMEEAGIGAPVEELAETLSEATVSVEQPSTTEEELLHAPEGEATPLETPESEERETVEPDQQVIEVANLKEEPPTVEGILDEPEPAAAITPSEEELPYPIPVEAIELPKESEIPDSLQPETEEAVFEEIQDFDSKAEPQNEFIGVSDVEITETPEISNPAVNTTTEQELQVPAVEVEESPGILDFVAHFALSKPAFEPIVEEVKQEQGEQKPQPLQTRKPISVSSLMKGASYNIEDYFGEDNAGGESIETVANDFFSWLSHPSRQEMKVLADSEESDQRKKQARDLINRFIATNPQVQRPKAEFFTPQSESRKSEEMPDDLVTETLAGIYHKQGNYSKAIKIYEALMLKMPEKSAYFASLIQKIKESNHQ